MERPDLWTVEERARAQGHVLICGVDEAGAGPLAGDVYAAAVILPYRLELPGLNDSKQVSPKKRELLCHFFKNLWERRLRFWDRFPPGPGRAGHALASSAHFLYNREVVADSTNLYRKDGTLPYAGSFLFYQ